MKAKKCPRCNRYYDESIGYCKYDRALLLYCPDDEIANIPKCPTCQSINIEKISTASKAAGAFAFGIFSTTARSQFKCNNCGYKW